MPLTQASINELQTSLSRGDRGGYYYVGYADRIAAENPEAAQQAPVQAQIAT